MVRIEEVCAAYSVPLRAAALQFPRSHPAVTTVLVGARSVSEVEQNTVLASLPIPSGFWGALKNEGLLADDAPLPVGRLLTDRRFKRSHPHK